MRLSRRKLSVQLVLAAVTLIISSTISGTPPARQTVQPTPFSAASVHERVEGLLRQMTLDEKIGQLNQVSAGDFLNPPNPEEMIRKGEIGSFLWSVDSAKLDKFQHIAVEQGRLHIPLLFGYDVIHGFRAVFPAPIAMASSWDPSVEEKAQTFAAREARAAGITWTFAPMVDIARDARWGRIVEGAGEDPYLGSAMARAQIRGFQGNELSAAADRVLACVKHYVAYGAAEGGRDYDSSYVPETSLRNVYLPPFHAAVNAGAGSLMSAYMDLNDVPATGNRYTLHDILRGEWGFRGFVVSDALAVGDLVTHGFARNREDAALRALTAGVNVDMASQTFSKNLQALVAAGKITEAEIDDAVRPILAVKFQMGLFEHPYTDLSQKDWVLADSAAREYARVAAQRSMVLLRNENHVLPLSKSISSVALLGPLANDSVGLNGGWGVPDQTPAVTVEQGIRAKLPNAAIAYARGGEIRRVVPSLFDAFFHTQKTQPLTDAENEREVEQAVEVARKSDISILVLGELANMSSEGASRSTLVLPGKQEELLEKVAALGKPVVLVVVGGRPLNIVRASEHVPAILAAWQPGTEAGNAIADILFGDANPGGKLPVSWPRSAGEEPLYYSHNLTHAPEGSRFYAPRYWEGSSSPLYPFGYGLSYTTFSVSNLKLEKSELRLGDKMDVTADVQNTGSVAGDEVVQLYVHQRAGSASRPIRELKGFERISLGPGEKKTIHFTLGKSELTFWSANKRQWVEEPEEFDVWVGSDSAAKEHAAFRVVP